MLMGWTQLDAFGWALAEVPLEREDFPGRWRGKPLLVPPV